MSAKKRTSLEAVFAAEEVPAPKPPTKSATKREAVDAEKPMLAAIQPQERAGGSKRHSVKQHTAYLPLAVHEQLRKLAFEENRKMHDYLMEGLDRVFADRGLPAVKDIA
ncbi:ribbon-helix-helix domain-containing protein [Paludibaculum fermentans]|uniref:ribbon-helix-helix domain-containing protein n=1 Tax=Paludibaculum fermentans TaxID=1473598 RepID=UPI003EC03486